jgi:hypothetical protein
MKGRYYSGDLGEDNIIMFLKKIGWKVVDWMDLDVGKCPVVDSCVHVNETSVSLKGEDFLDLLTD